MKQRILALSFLLLACVALAMDRTYPDLIQRLTVTGNTAIGGTLGVTGVTTLTGGLSAALPIASGGTANASLAVTAGGVLYTDGSKAVNTGAGTSGQVLLSAGTSAPTWGNASPVGSWYFAYSRNETFGLLDDIAVPEGANLNGAFRSLSSGTLRTVACTIASPGTGGTTGIVVSIYNATDSSQLCSCTLGACNAAGPLTCDCNTAFAASKTYTGRLTSGTDCAVNPAGLACNVEITR